MFKTIFRNVKNNYVKKKIFSKKIKNKDFNKCKNIILIH